MNKQPPLLHRIIIFCLVGIRPILGPARCKFTLSCTRFAILQLKEKTLFAALKEIIKRLFACSPLSGLK